MGKSTLVLAARPLAAFLLLVALGGSAYAQQSITPRELTQRLATRSQLVIFDIRDQTSFNRQTLPGAVNIVWDGVKLADSYAGYLNAYDREVIVVCQNGVQSQQAVRFLTAQGYTNASYVAGGLDAASAPQNNLTTWGVIKALFGSNYRQKQG